MTTAYTVDCAILYAMLSRVEKRFFSFSSVSLVVCLSVSPSSFGLASRVDKEKRMETLVFFPYKSHTQWPLG